MWPLPKKLLFSVSLENSPEGNNITFYLLVFTNITSEIQTSSVTLPANIASVGRKAFYNCKGLKTLNIKTSKLTDISAVGAKAFNGTPARMKVNIFVSKGKVYNAIRSTLIKRGVSGKAVFKKK